MGQDTEGEFWVGTASFTERQHPEPEFKSLQVPWRDLNVKAASCLLVSLCVGPQAQFSSGSSSPLSFLLDQHACCEEKQGVWDTGKALPKSPSLLQSGDSPWQSPPPRLFLNTSHITSTPAAWTDDCCDQARGPRKSSGRSISKNNLVPFSLWAAFHQAPVQPAPKPLQGPAHQGRGQASRTDACSRPGGLMCI